MYALRDGFAQAVAVEEREVLAAVAAGKDAGDGVFGDGRVGAVVDTQDDAGDVAAPQEAVHRGGVGHIHADVVADFKAALATGIDDADDAHRDVFEQDDFAERARVAVRGRCAEEVFRTFLVEDGDGSVVVDVFLVEGAPGDDGQVLHLEVLVARAGDFAGEFFVVVAHGGAGADHRGGAVDEVLFGKDGGVGGDEGADASGAAVAKLAGEDLDSVRAEVADAVQHLLLGALSQRDDADD